MKASRSRPISGSSTGRAARRCTCSGARQRVRPRRVTPDGRVVVAEQIPAVVAGSRYALHVIDLGAQPKLRLLTQELTGDSVVVVGKEAIVAVRAPGMGERPAAVPLGGGALCAPGRRSKVSTPDAGSVAWRTRAGCIEVPGTPPA